MSLTFHYIPACPFCQRVQAMLAYKGLNARFVPVDVTAPRSPELLALTRGSTALPVLETEGGVLKESMVILRYLDERYPEPPLARRDPFERAVEAMLLALEGPLTATGYRLIKTQEPPLRAELEASLLSEFRKIDDFLNQWNPTGTWLFEEFGLAELVYAPIFMRFWLLEYYDGFELPAAGFERVRRWRDAAVAHPAMQQVSREQIIKLYYDYSRGAGGGSLLPGRARSSFAFEPDWPSRPWPSRGKGGAVATDAELGLV